MTNQPDDQTHDQPHDQPHDQDSEPTSTAPDGGRPQTTASASGGDQGEEEDAELAD